MIDEDDAPKAPAAGFTARNLEALGAEELAAYRAELIAEIARVDEEIARKGTYRDRAASFFRTP